METPKITEHVSCRFTDIEGNSCTLVVQWRDVFGTHLRSPMILDLIASVDSLVENQRAIVVDGITKTTSRIDASNRCTDLERECDTLRARIADLESGLAEAQKERNSAETELKVARLNVQLLDRIIDLAGKDPVARIQALEEAVVAAERERNEVRAEGKVLRSHIAELERTGVPSPAEAERLLSEEINQLSSVLSGSTRLLVKQAAARVIKNLMRIRVAALDVEQSISLHYAEYQLDVGSRWDGDVVVEDDGFRVSISAAGSVQCVNSRGCSKSPSIRSVLALARRHRPELLSPFVATAPVPPADYPLCPSSTLVGNCLIVEQNKTRVHLKDGLLSLSYGASSTHADIRNILALAALHNLLPTAARWIPVGEKPPEDDRWVHVLWPDGVIGWELGISVQRNRERVTHWLDFRLPPLPGEVAAPEPVAVQVPVERIDPERLALVAGALAACTNDDFLAGDCAAWSVEAADAALAILRGRATP